MQLKERMKDSNELSKCLIEKTRTYNKISITIEQYIEI